MSALMTLKSWIKLLVLASSWCVAVQVTAHSIMPNGDLEFNSHRASQHSERKSNHGAGQPHTTQVTHGQLQSKHAYSRSQTQGYGYQGGGCCQGTMNAHCIPQVSCPTSGCIAQHQGDGYQSGRLPVCASADVTVKQIQEHSVPSRGQTSHDRTIWPKSNRPPPTASKSKPEKQGVVLRDQSGL